MRAFAVPMFLCALAVTAGDPDPPGTVVLKLHAGDVAPIQTRPAAEVICDDLTVVTPEFAADGSGFLLRALKPGSTLCGVWIADGAGPGGLYRVLVSTQSAPDAGATSDGGVGPTRR